MDLVTMIATGLKLVEGLRKMAKAQGYTPAQLDAAVALRLAELDQKVTNAETAEAAAIRG